MPSTATKAAESAVLIFSDCAATSSIGAIGSLGVIDPARIFKGKKMAGHLGCERVTIQNLAVVKVDAEKNLVLIKGGVPGPKGGLLIILYYTIIMFFFLLIFNNLLRV